VLYSKSFLVTHHWWCGCSFQTWLKAIHSLLLRYCWS